MVENVQCPVCTLFLHAGMNLSDHLETHPKEQVIRALVQMTISGNGNNSNALKAALSSTTSSGEIKPEEQENNKALKGGGDNDLSRSNSRLSTISSSSSTLCSTGSSINFATSFATQSIPQQQQPMQQQQQQKRDYVDLKIPQNYSKDARLNSINNNNNNLYEHQSLNSNESYHNRSGVSNDKNLNSNAIKVLNFRRYHQQQQQQHLPHQEQPLSQEQKLQIQTHHDAISSQLHNAHEQQNENQQQQPLALSKQHSSNMQQQQHLQEHRGSATQALPPPPPPPPQPAHSRHMLQLPIQQQQNAHQLSQLNTTDTSATIFSTTQHGLYVSVGQRQQHMQIEQQNLKNLYSAGGGGVGGVLPPLPPLQLFSYQQQSTQHQKPPPAYGAAISQIRSQQNLNKQNITISTPFIYSQTPHWHMQRHATNNNNPPRIVSNASSELTTTETTTSTTASLTFMTTSTTTTSSASTSMSSSTMKHVVQERSATATSVNSHAYEQKINDTITNQQQHSQQQQQQQQLNNRQHQPQAQSLLNAKNTDTANSESSTRATFNSTQHNLVEINEKLPPPSLLPAAQSSSSISSKSLVTAMTSYSSSSNVNYTTSAPSTSRQANSPFTSLLSAPSPSSVLRYAESPVAHYLERDNGDFIVQETPKHIVECVEEEDGEFSVIERYHQSPPSVLHIHDDKDDEDVDFGQADDVEEKSGSSSNSNSQLKKHTITSKRDKSRDCNNENDEQEFLSLKDEGDENDDDDVDAQDQQQSNIKRGNTNSNMSSSCSEVENNSCSNSNSTLDRVPKKSSKNSITVLSDVQLNLNEYLDLVGNIIASSKIAKRRTNHTATAPIPLVKVEKIDVDDDDDGVPSLIENNLRDDSLDQTMESVSNLSSEIPTSSTTNQIHKNANKRKETEQQQQQQFVEHNKIKYEHKIQVKSENAQGSKKNASEKSALVGHSYTKDRITPVAHHGSSGHATSVIRMATTSATSMTLNEQNQQQQQQIVELNIEKPHHHLQNSTVRTTIATESEIFTIEEVITAQDLSQPQKVDKTLSSSSSSASTVETDSIAKQQETTYTTCAPLPPPPPLRKGPKKLVIKPKSTKTEENAKNVDFNESNVFNDIPTTSRLSQRDHHHHSHNISYSQNSTLNQTQDLIIKFEPSSYEISCSNANLKADYSTFPEKQKPTNQQKQQQLHYMQSNNKDQEQNENSSIDHQNRDNDVKCKTEKNLPNDDSEQSNFSKSQYSLSNEAVDYRPIKSERASINAENDRIKERITCEKDLAATEDARVLLDFANSSKCTTISLGAGNFLSPHSMFSGCNSSKISEHSNTKSETNSNSGTAGAGGSIESSLRCEDEFIAVDEHELHEIISSSYSRQALTTTNSRDQSKQHAQSQDQIDQQQSTNDQTPTQQQTHSSFTECPFSFFYNNGNGNNNNNNNSTGTGIDSLPKTNNANQFSPTYHHQTPDATTTAVTVASSSTLDTLEDSVSTPAESNTIHNRFGGMQGALPQWYQSATLVANSDFESALSIDNAAVDGDVGKYLDLDACKRENSCSGVRMAASSTQSSFAVATESSMPGGSTSDTLNIRTDEKMPPKGEISEQESNCDIENSWSQPQVYGEIPSKFYRTSFPGIFQQDNGWNHEEFFTVQDLSHAASAATTANNSAKGTKSFDFHLPLDATPTTFVNSNLQLLHDDVFPSTSLGINKKKRKRISENKSEINRSKPTATITSQQFLQNVQMSTGNQEQPNPTTSSAALMASSSSTAASSRPKPRKKVYKCPHCSTEFSKLRDRNSHMIDAHNYIRQNRRLISSQATSTVVQAANNSVNTDASVISASETLLTFRTNASSTAAIPSRTDDFLLDSKHNIKIKMEYDQHTTILANSENMLPTDLHDGVNTKSEFDENKESLTVLGDVHNNGGALSVSTEDKKPNLAQSHALTAPTTKLATLYRMLVSFNVSTLKQNQNLTELEEKLIENSIFFCYTCRTNFSSVKLYDAHLTEHPAECFTCGKKFQRWKNFSLHLKRHLGWKEFACTVCDKKFVVRSALVEHTRMHTGHTPLKCKICGKCFKRYSNLTQHRKRHGRVHIRKKEFVCHCGEVLPSKARFLWHKETHDSKPKCCPHCCDRFVHANSLRRHIRLAHSDKFDYAEPMECPMCKQVFAKSSIKAHMATHSMDTQHDCKICNKSFSTKWNLKIHLWVHANRTAKPFKCEHCPKAFVREVDFKNHMNAHKQIKPYTCEYCGCKFIRKYNYMRHRREHHGNKKFTCELCKKSFHRHYYLIEHRRIHTGERPFQCTICGKSSTTKTNHNKHLKIHHSRDPFTVET